MAAGAIGIDEGADGLGKAALGVEIGRQTVRRQQECNAKYGPSHRPSNVRASMILQTGRGGVVTTDGGRGRAWVA